MAIIQRLRYNVKKKRGDRRSMVRTPDCGSGNIGSIPFGRLKFDIKPPFERLVVFNCRKRRAAHGTRKQTR